MVTVQSGEFLKEQVLEPFLRYFRIRKAINYIKLYPNCTLLDIGCGFEARLLLAAEPYIGQGFGIDRRAPKLCNSKIKTIKSDFGQKLPFDDQTIDFITLLAVLEHIDDDLNMLKECSRILRPGGGMLLTVPSWRAKPILEFLSLRLNLVNKEEILDHKRYYSKEDLLILCSKVPNLEITFHQYFQFKCNNQLFIKKT